MSETAVSRAIQVAIKRHFPEIRFTRLQCGMIRLKGRVMHLSEESWPDLIAYLPDGRFLGIEVKTPTSKTQKRRKELQDARLSDINACGGVGLKVTGVLDCIEKLKEVMK